ncbi:MAG: CHRD domain-containing protein [Dehalococcoidia bacterium]|nr:CHRD domain-containing protein [Dehalococcoidia bacterium]
MLNIKRASLGAIMTGLLLMLAAAGLQTETPAEAAILTWKANLTGAEENPPVPAGFGTGTGEFYFDDAPSERTLTYFVTVTGIDAANVTAAHIHRGPVGVNGPVIYPITAPDGTAAGITYFAGTQKLTEADVADLRAGNLYVNVHSVANPGGFARAQLFLPGSSAIISSIQGTIDAWNDQDVERFIAGFTDAGLVDVLALDPETAEADLETFIGEDEVSLSSLTNVRISGTTATGDLVLEVGNALEAYTQDFVLEGGIWKLDSAVLVPAPVPAGVQTVDMELREFAFVYDKSKVTSGRFAIEYDNTGDQVHEIVLFKLDTTAPLLQFLQSVDMEGPPPEELEFIAARAPIEAGEQGNIVFSQPLSNGRYALICFLPDTDDPEETPHFIKGMFSEFPVDAGGGGVTPPSTGDAGLIASHSQELSLSFLALGAIAIVAGLGGLTVAARRVR